MLTAKAPIKALISIGQLAVSKIKILETFTNLQPILAENNKNIVDSSSKIFLLYFMQYSTYLWMDVLIIPFVRSWCKVVRSWDWIGTKLVGLNSLQGKFKVSNTTYTPSLHTLWWSIFVCVASKQKLHLNCILSSVVAALSQRSDKWISVRSGSPFQHQMQSEFWLLWCCYLQLTAWSAGLSVLHFYENDHGRENSSEVKQSNNIK